LVGGLIDLPRAEYPPGLENLVILVRFWGGLENQEQDAHDVEGTNDGSIPIKSSITFLQRESPEVAQSGHSNFGCVR
jgi:hypothetical protein